MILSFFEIFNIILVILGVGFIFQGLFPLRGTKRDVLDTFTKGFDWSEFWFVCKVAAPGIILHEMGHKFVALAFGLQAIFHASYFGLIVGIILKLLGSGFIFLAPGYVSLSGATVVQGMLTALAGPLINLLLWLLAFFILRRKGSMSRRTVIFWSLTEQMNKWLFIFNMLPLPPLDGSKFWLPLFSLLF